MTPLPVAEAWFSVDEVDPGILRVTEPHCDRLIRANFYLVKGSERHLLVDSGMGIGSLRSVLAPHLDKPLVIFSTHTHVDHMGGHREFRDCEILVHPAEADDLRQPAVPRGLAFDHFDAASRQDLKAMGFSLEGLLIDAIPAAGYDPDGYRCEGVEPTAFVVAGDVVDLGDRRFEILHLPGHSPGGLGLWDAATGVLLTGDTLYDGLLLDTIPGADIKAYLNSVARLRALPTRLVLGGHREPFGRERMVELIDIYTAYRSGASV